MRRRWLYVGATLVFCAILVINAAHAPVAALHEGQGIDFLPIQAGAQLLQSQPSALYDKESQRRAEVALLGYTPVDQRFFPDYYVYPPVVAWAAQPLAGLGLSDAITPYITVLVLAQLLALLMLRRLVPRSWSGLDRLLLVVSVGLSLPAEVGIGLGQISAVLLLCVTGAFLLLQRAPLIAGMLLSVLLVKPQLMLLLPVVLVVAQQWRVLLGFVGGGMTMLLGSLLLVRGNLWSWVALVLSPSVTGTTEPSIPETIATAVGQQSVAFVIAAMGLAATALFMWRIRLRLRMDVSWAVAFALIASLTWAPHVGNYDLLVLAAPFVVWAKHSRAPLHLSLLLNGVYAIALLTGDPNALGAVVLLITVVVVGRELLERSTAPRAQAVRYAGSAPP